MSQSNQKSVVVKYTPIPRFYVWLDEPSWHWKVRCDQTGDREYSSWYLEADATKDAESRNRAAILARLVKQPVCHT